MVQRKAPIKPVALTEPKRTHVKPESHLAQDTRSKGGGGGDLKKKMKMIRSMKASDLASLEVSAPAHKNSQFNESSRPKGTSAIKKTSERSPNYMKPTSCWDARKEQMQVTIHSPTTTDKNLSPKKPRNLNHSKTSNSSPAGSGLKPFKILSRKPSLKRAWPLIKKSSGVSLYHQKVENRATCSSTLKDSKFPTALELNPGATEAEGTSVMRVCPYNYCSLNGHTHAPLPPLKSFMSARRALIKTQKSFKLKGLPSFRMKGLGKDENEIDTGQKAICRTPSGLAIIPLIEEIANDFFVEIYAKPQEQTVELQNCDERKFPKEDDIQTPQVLDGSSMNQDDDEGTKSEVDEESVRDALNQRHESYKDMGLEDDLDQKSDLSVEEMDDMKNSLEYVECDKKIADEEDNHPSSVPEDYAEWRLKCYIFDVLGKESEGLVESETMISISKGTDPDYEGIAEEGNTDDVKSENNDAPASSEENEQDEELTRGTEPLSSEQNASDLSFLGCKEEVSEEREESNEQVAFPDQDKNGIDIMKGETFESADLETNQHLDDENPHHIILSIGMKEEENGDDEVEATSSLSIIQLSESCQGSTEVDTDDFAEGDHIQTKLEAEECNCDDATEDQIITPEIHIPSVDQSYEDSRERIKHSSEKQQEEVNEIERSVIKDIKHDCNDVNEETQVEDDVDSDADDICLLPSNKSSKEDKTIHNARAKSNHPPTKAVDRPKARLRIVRKRTTEESEQMKEFNPRPPNFLPVEPDPEAEKVDLRHQTTDERKNAEEWMVDYALQQAVSKLAPARKRKVALLVEAFETVKPLPICEEPLRHTTSGFANARLQACS